MTRLESTAKGGYFPFDPKLLPIVASYVQPAPQGGRLLDPCAGEGAALEALAHHWQLTPYANEVDPGRAGECLKHFGVNQAVKGDLFRLRASPASFTCLWLNPPYGSDTTGSDKRIEFNALKHAWKWAAPGALVFWVVYQHHVTLKVMEWLSTRVTQAALLACPGLHLGEYQQVVFILRVGKPDKPDSALFDLVEILHTPPAELTLQASPLFSLPEPRPEKSFTFLPDSLTPELALNLLSAHKNAHSRADFQHLLYAPPPQKLEQPAITPRGGQMGLVLASGLFNGMTLQTELGHSALRSTIHYERAKARDEYEGDPDSQDCIHREIFLTKPVTTITLLNEQGELKDISGDNALINFIQKHKPDLINWLEAELTPRYDFKLGALAPTLSKLRLKGKALYPTQQHAIAACHRTLQVKKAVILVGEMGVGKTAIGSSLLVTLREQMKPGQVNLVMCPSHLVEKWQSEIQMIAPTSHSAILETVDEVKRFMDHAESYPQQMHVGILSKEMAKLGEGWKAAVVWRKAHYRHPDTKKVESSKLPSCPVCGDLLYRDQERRSLAKETWLQSSKRTCPTCKTPLWQDARTFSAPKTGQPYPVRNPRMPLADYLTKRYPGRLYAFLCDELHETKDPHTGQGQAMLTLSQNAEKVIGLTGTIYGGVASSLFGIEFAVNPRMPQRYPWRGGRVKWIQDMGTLQDILEHRPSYDSQTGAFTGVRTYQREAVEVAGCSPLLVREILDHTVFVGLKDFAKALPTYEEIPIAVEPDPDMKLRYAEGEGKLRDYLAAQRRQGDVSFMSAYLQSSLSWMSAAYDTEAVIHHYRPNRENRELVLNIPVHTFKGMGADRIYPKEQKLLELVNQELAQGRGVAIFCRQTGEKRDLTQRLEKLIREHAPLAKPYVLHASVQAKRREQLLSAQFRNGVNVLLANPELVKTGLDLLATPTLIFYEVSYSLYTMAQASRRAWRLTQDQPCRTYYLYYPDTMEERAVELVARKQRAAALLSGDRMGGLSELDGSGSGKLLSELANTIAEDHTVTDLRALFAREQNLETESVWVEAEIPEASEPQPMVAAPQPELAATSVEPVTLAETIATDPILKQAAAEAVVISEAPKTEPKPQTETPPKPAAPKRTKRPQTLDEAPAPLPFVPTVWKPIREAHQIPLL